MLHVYAHRHGRLAPLDALPGAGGETPVWIDLLNPSPEEVAAVRARLQVPVPAPADLLNIELTHRLYDEGGAEIMTMTALVDLHDDEPTKTLVTFVLKDDTLVTVRTAQPKPFEAFLARAGKEGGAPSQTGEVVMAGLIEALVDRLADALDRTGNEVDAMSRTVFRRKSANVERKTRNLEALLEKIGRKGDLISMIQDSLVSAGRLSSYHASETEGDDVADFCRRRMTLIQRETAALGEYAATLSNKVTFLLDATLGLINLQQNQIIKIFSIASVVFLPPTLIASIYGMNFDIMPELKWLLGYPWALGLMVVSAILPYLFFRKKGWL